VGVRVSDNMNQVLLLGKPLRLEIGRRVFIYSSRDRVLGSVFFISARAAAGLLRTGRPGGAQAFPFRTGESNTCQAGPHLDRNRSRIVRQTCRPLG
jgi:hypothetical protein